MITEQDWRDSMEAARDEARAAGRRVRVFGAKHPTAGWVYMINCGCSFCARFYRTRRLES